ncbi:MAG TPA: replicative DNA helicase [Firmicutes bacterium]|nr:replicative DNA helicase [Bacillota bacterium]
MDNLRQPPMNLDAEKAVLGSMLIDPDTIDVVADIIGPGDFYSPLYGKLFEVLLSTRQAGDAINVVTVNNRASELVKRLGGVSALIEISNSVPSSAEAEAYAKIVQQKSILRAVIRAAMESQKDAYDDLDADEVLQKAQQRFLNIGLSSRVEAHPISDVVACVMERIDELQERRSGISGLETGFYDLDNATSGLHEGELIIIAGRPAMGKTTFALDIVRHVAIELKKPALIFSLEMPREQVVIKLMSAISGVNGQAIRTGFFAKEDWPKLVEASGILGDAPIAIVDEPGLSVGKCRMLARRMKQQRDIHLVMVDYMQLLVADGRYESRQQEMSAITKDLKLMARELQVPVIALSQLNRAVEMRQDKRPTLADLRESGEIEQSADVVMLLYREDYYKKDSDKPGITEIMLAKQRMGTPCTVELKFMPALSRFENLSMLEELI